VRKRPRLSLFGWTLARVHGDSMAPTLQHGDYVIARRSQVRAGAIMLVRHPRLGLLVKRISAVASDGGFRLAGDNPMSASGQTLGQLDTGVWCAAVRWRISPAGTSRPE
jgi:phage repressor protein C with HTH and peptisase S24 domain